METGRQGRVGGIVTHVPTHQVRSASDDQSAAERLADGFGFRVDVQGCQAVNRERPSAERPLSTFTIHCLTLRLASGPACGGCPGTAVVWSGTGSRGGRS